jgi:hypothetical protein
MGVAQRMQARALRQPQSPAQQRYRRRHRIGLQWCAIWIREYQIQVGAVIGTEMLTEPSLLLAVGCEGR